MEEEYGYPGGDSKTLIGVLASRDSEYANRLLASLIAYAARVEGSGMTDFHFVFTGGTYKRLFFGDPSQPSSTPWLGRKILDSLSRTCGISVLPTAAEGGMTMLSYLITKGQCSIVWPLFAPTENHWLRPENLAFMRLCDQWHVKRLMNRESILNWIHDESVLDAKRNRQPCKPNVCVRLGEATSTNGTREIWLTPPSDLMMARGKRNPVPEWEKSADRKPVTAMTIALIAHDRMKARMTEFATDHEQELKHFKCILATGTTGREVKDAAPQTSGKVCLCHSGPKGGDIEIATEVLHKRCDIVVFFLDPLRPHPHIDDIRVVFEACMTNQDVVMITNEMHAREFMVRVIREWRGLWQFTAKQATR